MTLPVPEAPVQRAYIRLPTFGEAYSLLPGGPPSAELGPPPGAEVRWTPSVDDWPVIETRAAVPEGSVFLFTAGQLLLDQLVGSEHLDGWLRRVLHFSGWALRRLFALLDFIPLAWTAPAPGHDPSPERYMTSPSTPPRVYPSDGVQLTVRYNHAGQPAVVVLGGRLAAGTAITSGMAEAWRDHFHTNARPLIHAETLITGATLRDTRVANGPQVDVGAPATNQAGSVTGAKVLASGSTLIKWSTATGGRRGKGRTFIPGAPATALDLNGRSYTAAWTTAVNTFVAAYLGAPAGIPAPAVLSFTYGLASPITAGALAPVFGLQRRRMRA